MMQLLDGMICQNSVKAWRIIGVLISIVKVLVPLIIIITSVVPIFNALIKGTADETIKSWKQIGRKIAAGVIIFLIPGLVESSVRLFANKETETEDVLICVYCFSNPNSSECKKAVNDFDTAEEREAEEIKNKNKGKNDDSVIEGGSLDTDKMGNAEESSEE